MSKIAKVRIMRSEIKNIKNVNYGEIDYINKGSINSKGIISKPDIVGLYGQNGSGKTALVESMDMLRGILMGGALHYDVYAGILPADGTASITTDFFIEYEYASYKASYTAYFRVNKTIKRIEIYKEKLVYWQRGSSWKRERDIEFENPMYNSDNLLEEQMLTVKSDHESDLKTIPFLWSMQNLALISAQNYSSTFFNTHVYSSLQKNAVDSEGVALRDVIIGIMNFAYVDLNVIKVNQLGTINSNQVIPIHTHRETEFSTSQDLICLNIMQETNLFIDYIDIVRNVIDAINIVLKSVIPNLQIEIEEKKEIEHPDGKKYVTVEAYSNRGGKRFLLRYESEGIKRIVSILNYLIAVYNDPGVCLVVDELDSGIFEYLLGELLGVLHKEMKGQLIFTSHNLRILEKLDAKNIYCSTTNPDNRFIRLVGIEKNHNKRDFYIRSITIGGQKEELYDEKDLIAMDYAFRKAGKSEADTVELRFSDEVEKDLREKVEGM